MTNCQFRSFAVIPAAGRSARMGSPKPLLPWRGGTLIEHVVKVWRQSRVNELIVVVSPENEALADVCRTLPCHTVIPRLPPPDMKASVCRGLEYIAANFSPTQQDVWLVAPADLPQISAAVIEAILAAYDPSSPCSIVPVQGSRRGHPVLFPWPRAADVFSLGPDESLKQLVERQSPQPVEVASDISFDDLDTPQDYLRLRGQGTGYRE